MQQAIRTGVLTAGAQCEVACQKQVGHGQQLFGRLRHRRQFHLHLQLYDADVTLFPVLAGADELSYTLYRQNKMCI